MNWRRLYATVQTCAVVGGLAIGGGVFWGMVVTGVCRKAFSLEERSAMLLIFLPLAVFTTACFVRFLPKHLRRAGVLSYDPKKFGPWFKRDGEA